MAQFDLKNALILIQDGAGTGTNNPHTLTVKLGEGTLSYTEHKDRQYYRDRGKLSEVRNGDEQPIDVRLDATWEFISGSGGSEITIEDALKQKNNAASWTSSDTADACQPYSVDIDIYYIPICSSVQGEVIRLKKFRYESIDHDSKAGTFAISGKCNVVEADVERGTVSLSGSTLIAPKDNATGSSTITLT